MNNAQKAQAWQDELGAMTTFREERANHIITALLAEREVLLNSLKASANNVDNLGGFSKAYRITIQLCEAEK